MFQLTPHLYDKIKYFARFPQTGVSLKQMVMFGQNPSQGTLFKATQFLHEELPIRLAHRVKELEELPRELGDMPSILKVKQWYAESFQDLIELRRPQWKPTITTSSSLPPPSLSRPLSTRPLSTMPSTTHCYYTHVDTPITKDITDYNHAFLHTLHTIKRRHDPVVATMAQGIHEYTSTVDPTLQDFLDRFYTSRMGIRILIGQHLQLSRQHRPDYVGVICTRTNIKTIAQNAIDQAQQICQDHYGLVSPPTVRMVCPADIEFMYVPSHLEHILFELVKNALRAVVERFDHDYPPIQVIVDYGREDITIKISDQGGGIARSKIPLVWTYMYTTAAQQVVDPDDIFSDTKVPMAGFGCGLPLSRLYARYFGGDLKLVSKEGHGTDVYLHLNRLSNSEEPLM
ncbi:mitochondrial branched-chain alpha-ketoacid dehydrogenase kinase-domain-containing protein [Chlamydoabsidia padenii]|nr:mitochondrial branched-chain alpha-ketoacid dehydrogenase kinase-domain-containing protein [Chlamydoabsidia padenii]